MKKPYLARYIENHNFVKEDRFHYDEVSQMSYLCSDRSIKVIDKAFLGGSSIHTFSDECSDPDELNFVESSILTENGENTDPDEMHAIGISYTTRTVEDSDPDGMHMVESSYKTATDETSDPDEISCLNYYDNIS